MTGRRVEMARIEVRRLRVAAMDLHVHLHRDRSHLELDRQRERAAFVQALQEQDPEKEMMKRQIAELNAIVSNLAQVQHAQAIREAPSVSFLDEVLLALEAKPVDVKAVVRDVPIPSSLVDALAADNE